MSHTVHPYAHRLGIIRDWKSRWFSVNKKYRSSLKEDLVLREFLEKRLRGMSVGGVDIERGSKALRIIVKTSRPGLIIGRSGEGRSLKEEIVSKLTKLKLSTYPEIKLDIEEIRLQSQTL